MGSWGANILCVRALWVDGNDASMWKVVTLELNRFAKLSLDEIKGVQDATENSSRSKPMQVGWEAGLAQTFWFV